VLPEEEDQAKATGDMHKKFSEDRSSDSKDMLMDRQIATTVIDSNTPLPYKGRVMNENRSVTIMNS